VPLGYVNINKNIVVQIIAVVSVVVMTILWTIDFSRIGFNSTLSVWNLNQQNVLGTVMFNFVVGVAVPSWCNEKKPTTNATHVIVASTSIAALLFLYVGFLGSVAFHYSNEETLLTLITECKSCFVLTRMTAFYLPAAVFLTSIPVYSIIVKYNLLENNICKKPMAFFISVIVPWLFAVPFYTGTGLIEVINWASLFLQSFINFILPMILLIKSRKRRGDYTPIESIQDSESEPYFRALPKSIDFIGSGLSLVIILLIIISVIFVTILNILQIN